MKYETVTSIKGWVSLIVAGLGSLGCISAYGVGHTLQDCAIATLVLFFGFALGISWMRARRHIRAMQYQSRTLRKGMNSLRQRGEL